MTSGMITRTIHLLVAAAAGVATMPAHDASAQTRPVAEDFFGVNIQTLVYHLPERLPRHLDGVREAGLDTVRFDAAWAAVEPRPPVGGVHRYDWSRFDQVMAQLAQRGLRWLPIVDYSTRWTASQPGNFRSPPTSIPAYASYAGALAARYGRNGSFWREHPELPAMPVLDYEIWNEPNYVSTAFPVDRYAEAYLQARSAIRGSDPEARAWVGGLGPGASDFLNGMIDHQPELLRNLDAVALHPYAATPDGVFSYVTELRRTMDALGLIDVPIAVTESGWATQGRQPVPHASDAVRARYYRSVTDVLARSDCGVNSLFPHTWVTLERDPLSAGDWFGIVRPDGTSTATSRAYADAVAENRRWRSQTGSAGVALCDRRPSARLSSRRQRGTPSAPTSGASNTGQVTRRRLRPRTCQRAIVTLHRSPLSGAGVQFVYRDRRGRITRSVSRQTSSSGVATDCVVKARRQRRARRLRLRVLASRADLAHVATADAGVLIR